jgi:hypothetical protein
MELRLLMAAVVVALGAEVMLVALCLQPPATGWPLEVLPGSAASG